MIKSLRDAQIIDGLPRIVREQPWVKALSMAAAVLHKKTMDYIDGSQIYTAIDSVAEPVLDALAVNWKIDWYDTGYDIDGHSGRSPGAGGRYLSGFNPGGMV